MTESLVQEENLEEQEIREKYGRDFLIHEIALRAGFTIGDARIMFNTFEGIVEDIVAERSELLIGKLFHIYAKKSDPRDNAYSIGEKRHVHSDVRYRLTIKPSITLKKLWKFGKAKTENPLKEEEK
jgi:hypothetical protein